MVKFSLIFIGSIALHFATYPNYDNFYVKWLLVKRSLGYDSCR